MTSIKAALLLGVAIVSGLIGTPVFYEGVDDSFGGCCTHPDLGSVATMVGGAILLAVGFVIACMFIGGAFDGEEDDG